MIDIVTVTLLKRSMKGVFILAVILMVRKLLNIRSIKWANFMLWTIFFIYLLFPYSVAYTIQAPDSGWQGGTEGILSLLLSARHLIRETEKAVNLYLSPINRYFVTGLFVIYVVLRVIKRNKAMKGSVYIEKDRRMERSFHLFKFKRKIGILINDNITSPMTYGVLFPKIILPGYVLLDDELLKYVLIHELTHIKKFDIVFTHIKNLIMCLNWYNPFILGAAKYIEDDIEMLCDKLVIQKVGDTGEHRKQYCMAMLKLVETNANGGFVLNMRPTKERIIVMKKWKRTMAGVLTLGLASVFAVGMFSEVQATEHDQVTVVYGEPAQPAHVLNDRVEVITEDQYHSLLGKASDITLFSADIDETEVLGKLEYKEYKFNMSSRTGAEHDGFTVKLSDVSSKGELDYVVIIKEDNRVIYKKSFKKDVTLKVKAKDDRRYEVVIDNNSLDSLRYKIKINSYIR